MEKKPDPAPEKRHRVTNSTLKRNPNIKREMRPELEQAVITKLETLGIKPVSSSPAEEVPTQTCRFHIFIMFVSPQDQSGLKNKELKSILDKIHSKREIIAKGMPDYWLHWQEISSSVGKKLVGEKRGSDPSPEAQARSRSVQGESSKSLFFCQQLTFSYNL